MAVQVAGGIPRALRTRARLLDAITTFDGGAGGNALRWLEGVAFEARTCRDIQVGDIDPCADDTLSPGVASCDPWYVQKPFEFLDVITASTLNLTAERITEMLERNVDEAESWVMARGLMSVFTVNTLTLPNQAHAPDEAAFGSGALSVKRSLSIIENELAENLHDATGLIHVTPGMLAEIVGTTGAVRVAGNLWETATGHTIVADAGYRFMPQPAGQSAPAAGTDWIYGSGPIQYQMRDAAQIADGSNEILDRSKNDLRMWIWGAGILIFDPCPVTAVLATYGS